MNCRRLSLLLSLLLVIFLLMPDCNSSSAAYGESKGELDVELSFPNGAPALNQMAELVCTVSTAYSLKDMSINIDLPEAFELVSGELAWQGDISRGDKDAGKIVFKRDVIIAVVKAVMVGNWTISCDSYLDPDKQGWGLGMDGTYPIYVSVSEDSAEWAPWPLWDEVDPSAVPIEQWGDEQSPSHEDD